MEAIYVRLDKVAAELATKVDAVDSNCRERFDTLDRNVKLLPNKVSGTNWPAFVTTLLAAATGVGAPIAAAILLGPGS